MGCVPLILVKASLSILSFPVYLVAVKHVRVPHTDVELNAWMQTWLSPDLSAFPGMEKVNINGLKPELPETITPVPGVSPSLTKYSTLSMSPPLKVAVPAT